MTFSMPEVPSFAKREIEKLQEIITPLLKKASKYSFLALPMTLVSIINLTMIVLFNPNREDMGFAIILYAIIGAVGMALSKEAKHQQKEIQKVSTDYMVGRINNSNIAPTYLKKKYIEMIKEQPLTSLQYFINFLEEEDRANQYNH